jgi:hypothetical protein
MLLRKFDCLLPELDVLKFTRLATPSAADPAMHPLVHPCDEVLRVAGEQDAASLPFARDDPESLDCASQGHLVVGRRWLGDPVIEAHESAGLGRLVLDDAGGAAGIAPLAAVAEARFVGVDRDEGQGIGHRTTSMASTSSR